MLRKIGRWYSSYSQKYPLRVASVTAGSVLFSADVVAQSSQKKEWDSQRTLALTMFGFLYYGFPCKLLYLSYDRIFGLGRGHLKALCDVFLHTPFLLIPSFYLSTGLVKGHSLEQIRKQLTNDWLEARLGSVCFWTPAQLVCFTFVPQHSRILFVAAASFIHKVWLSTISNR